MYGLLLWFVVISLLEFYDYYVLRGSRGDRRLISLLAISAAAIAAPFLLPTNWLEVRFVVSLVTFNKIIKSLEIAYDRTKDPAMLTSFARFLCWSGNFPDTTWPQTPEIAAATRREGGLRLLRALPKMLLFLGLLALSTVLPEMHHRYWLTIVWWGALGYLGFSGTCDIVTGSFMLTGIHICELFDKPFFARTPREFWGKRWNLYVRDACHRNVFLPLGGKERPLLAAAAVFAVTGLLHEYIVLVAIGPRMLGWMSCFFVLQYMVTVAETWLHYKLGKKKLLPRPLAILCTILWLLVTSPFLIEPMLQVFTVTTWRLW